MTDDMTVEYALTHLYESAIDELSTYDYDRRDWLKHCHDVVAGALGTQSGTSVAPEAGDPKNTGSKPEVDQ